MIFLFSVISISIFSQEKETKEDVNKIIENIKKEIADKTCKCIDSVKDEVINRKRKENIEGINGCVKEYTGAYIFTL